MKIKPQAKILTLDIETRPVKAYVWSLWDQNVGINQIIDNGGVICVGAKWLGDPNTVLFSDWEHGHQGMLQGIYDMMEQADAILTYNGDKFDLPKLRGEFLLNGFGPLPPCTSIDLYKAIKKLGFISGKLAFVGPLLSMGAKITTGGFDLWKNVEAGSSVAQNKMARYCKQDVRLLEKCYLKVLPYITNHPFLGDRGHCGACDGTILHSRGYRRTKSFKIQRLQCTNCGSWQDGKREMVKAVA